MIDMLQVGHITRAFRPSLQEAEDATGQPDATKKTMLEKWNTFIHARVFIHASTLLSAHNSFARPSSRLLCPEFLRPLGRHWRKDVEEEHRFPYCPGFRKLGWGDFDGKVFF